MGAWKRHHSSGPKDLIALADSEYEKQHPPARRSISSSEKSPLDCPRIDQSASQAAAAAAAAAAMDESYANLPTSHLLGSVPAVVTDEKSPLNREAASMQTFPPNTNDAGGSGRGYGYQTLDTPPEAFEQQPPNNWKGLFSVSSYAQYFNVDTDVVINRLMSSFYPIGGDFFRKIDANPDLYGLIWISTTLVFVLSSFGNCATYLIQKHADKSSSWTFDVGFVNVAAGVIYVYAIVVPLAFYFLLRYMGSSPSLIRFWCLWGYSFFIFVPISFLLLIPVEILRWIIILGAGIDSACFVAFNLKSYIEGNDLQVVVVAAFCLQLALAIFIKAWFFA